MVECGEQQGREMEFGQKNGGRKMRREMKGTGRRDSWDSELGCPGSFGWNSPPTRLCLSTNCSLGNAEENVIYAVRNAPEWDTFGKTRDRGAWSVGAWSGGENADMGKVGE